MESISGNEGGMEGIEDDGIELEGEIGLEDGIETVDKDDEIEDDCTADGTRAMTVTGGAVAATDCIGAIVIVFALMSALS